MTDTIFNHIVDNNRIEESQRSLSGLRDSSGMLPISQSTFSADYDLVGSGESYPSCGDYFFKGCLNVDKHKGVDLYGENFSNKAYVELHHNSCHRAICPICKQDWIDRETDKAKQRINAYVIRDKFGNAKKSIHVAISVCHEDYNLDYKRMRQKVNRILKKVHFIGGLVVYHSKRFNPVKGWFFSPHFHVIGYGWIIDVRKTYNFYGYIVKNLGVRKTVSGTIRYQLSHCAIIPKGHSVTWIGALSYNQLKVKYRPPKENICPICGSKLETVVQVAVMSTYIEHEKILRSRYFFDDAVRWCNFKDRKF